MNKKGFTLVELLAVIVLLGLIALVAAPAITGIIKQSKDSLSDSQMKSIEMSAKNWSTDHMMDLPQDGECIWVRLSTLQAGGYADLEIKNPKTGDPMDACVRITRDEKMLIYEVDTDCIGTCSTSY